MNRQTSRPTLTALCAPPPEAAAHSRSADIVISREMTRHTGTAMPKGEMGAGGAVASSTSAVDTLRGSRQEGGVGVGWVGGGRPGSGGRRPGMGETAPEAKQAARGQRPQSQVHPLNCHTRAALPPALLKPAQPCPAVPRSHDFVGHGVQEGAKGTRDLHLQAGRQAGRRAAATAGRQVGGR